MPFRVNELTLAANPLKVREYLAAGLPCVSTAIPEVERLEVCRIGKDPDDIVRQIAGGHLGRCGPQRSARGADAQRRLGSARGRHAGDCRGGAGRAEAEGCLRRWISTTTRISRGPFRRAR